MKPLLTIAVSTLGTGVERVVIPPPHNDVCYLVVWQEPTPYTSAWMDRPDVSVLRMEGRGLSRSRNAALDAVTTQYVWLFDDDAVPFVEAGLVLAMRARDKGWSVATGCVQTPEGLPFKRYPKEERAWTVWSAPKVSSIETIVDVAKLRLSADRFDESFGLGARWTMGEEFVFLASVLRSGHKAFFVPVVLAIHPDESTGKDFGRDAVWQASSAALGQVFGLWAFPVRLVMALRKRRVLGWRNVWRYLWVRN